jgi:hypothetical protein
MAVAVSGALFNLTVAHDLLVKESFVPGVANVSRRDDAKLDGELLQSICDEFEAQGWRWRAGEFSVSVCR